jgi:hypothetical protein
VYLLARGLNLIHTLHCPMDADGYDMNKALQAGIDFYSLFPE